MPEVLIRVPAALRGFTGGKPEVRVEAATVGEALARLGQSYPPVLVRILTPDGQPRPFVNVFVGEQRIQGLQGLDTPLAPGCVISIIPAVAGGGHEAPARCGCAH
ncbi:MAG: MoaD/ThiS family protein [Gammaproteobacteria bacterium]